MRLGRILGWVSTACLGGLALWLLVLGVVTVPAAVDGWWASEHADVCTGRSTERCLVAESGAITGDRHQESRSTPRQFRFTGAEHETWFTLRIGPADPRHRIETADENDPVTGLFWDGDLVALETPDGRIGTTRGGSGRLAGTVGLLVIAGGVGVASATSLRSMRRGTDGTKGGWAVVSGCMLGGLGILMFGALLGVLWGLVAGAVCFGLGWLVVRSLRTTRVVSD